MNPDDKRSAEDLVDKHFPDGYYDLGDDHSKYNLNGKRIENERYRSQVGRVITQAGLVGALVVSFDQKYKTYKIQLKDGTIHDGRWDHLYRFKATDDPPGVSSNGWFVGDVKPDEDDLPF
jgi:hypothetical protein